MTTVGKLLNQNAVIRAATISLLTPEERRRLSEMAALGVQRELRAASQLNDLILDLTEKVA